MRGLIGLTITLTFAGGANAAPWTHDEGGYYGRIALSAESISGLSAARADVYGEYGVNDDWTLTAKSEAVAFTNFPEFDQESYRVTVRRTLWEKNGWLVSVEGGPVYGSAVGGLLGQCQKLGGELRVSGGISGARNGRDFYAFADAIRIQHQDQCHRNRTEFGLGTEIVDNVFLGQQIWAENGSASATSVKTETNLALHRGSFNVSLGYREEIGGRFKERGVVLAFVRKV